MMKPFHTAWAIKQSFVREFCSSFLSMFRVPTFIWFWIFYQDGKSIRLHCKSMMGFDNERHVLFAGKNMLEPLRKFKTSRISLYLDSLLSLNEYIVLRVFHMCLNVQVHIDYLTRATLSPLNSINNLEHHLQKQKWTLNTSAHSLSQHLFNC